MSSGRIFGPGKRRTRDKNDAPMYAGDPETVDAITEIEVNVPGRPGRTKIVAIPLVPDQLDVDGSKEPHRQAPSSATAEPNTGDDDHFHGQTGGGKKQRDYIKEFVARVDELLQALLSREALPIKEQICRGCTDNRLAGWRCIDCSLAQPRCRRCMRSAHMQNPFHRLECWSDTYFRRAGMWEVGVYILVEHHTGDRQCSGLEFQTKYLDEMQLRSDLQDQKRLELYQRSTPTMKPKPAPPMSAFTYDAWGVNPLHSGGLERQHPTWEDEQRSDATFADWIEAHHSRDMDDQSQTHDNDAEDGDDDANADATESDVHGFDHYLSADQSRPGADALNNSYVRVLHTNGVHHLAMVFCTCHGQESVPLDLIASRLIPASFNRIRTLFTTEVLDHFRLCNLELKASAYQFHQLIRRLTLPVGQTEVVNLYHELRRMSRLWRWFKKLKWGGYGHNGQDATKPTPGSLANFCPTCPQPGVNLPDNWKEDHNRYVFRVALVGDGNFKADHVRQRSEGDVWLINGAGMAPNTDLYYTFLAKAIEMYTKAPCENTFRAIQNALLASKACDLTGVIAIVCARHGCFIPNAMVDLFKGEQQKNMDFALLQAIKMLGLDPDQGLLLIYDIVCQYIVHLYDRIGKDLPPKLRIEKAIDLFHVHAHKDECFFRFATTFIPGAAVVAGQILESLWSNLNSVASMARTATLPHRAEMLDDHACDSNHKKLLGMTETLRGRHVDASAMATQADIYYLEITHSVDQSIRNVWEKEVVLAENSRHIDIKRMDIYRARLPNTPGQEGQSSTISAPASDADADSSPLNRWIHFALLVEEQQIDIQDRVRRLGKNPRDDDVQAVEHKRRQLTTMIVKLRSLQNIAGVNDVGNLFSVTPDGQESDFDEVTEEADAEPNADPLSSNLPTPELSRDDSVPVEREILYLPSNGNVAGEHQGLEMDLRVTQARMAISRLRDLIADISFQYSHVIRVAPRKGISTRAQQRVKLLHADLVLQARLYRRCRSALIDLKCPPELLGKFRILTKDDLKSSTAILRPNTAGSSSLQLSWIWQGGRWYLLNDNIQNHADADADADPATIMEFKRVHWLRARAQKDRWHEELLVVTYEMQWTVRYFIKKSNEWNIATNLPHISPGSFSYARRKSLWWKRLAYVADRLYKATTSQYVSPL